MPGDQNFSTMASGPRTPDLRAALRRQWLVILGCVLLASLVGYGYASTRKATFESRATVLLIATSTEDSPGGGLGRTLDVETQATVARATSLLTTVGDKLGMTLGQVRLSSRAEAAPTGDILYLFFDAPTAERAAEGATVYTAEFLTQRRAFVEESVTAERELLTRQLDALTTEIADLTNQIEDNLALGDAASDTEYSVLVQSQALAIRDLSTVRDSLASIDDIAEAGRVVVDPRTAVNKTGLKVSFTVLSAALVGLLVGFVVALLRDRNDDRYGSAVGLDVLGIRESGRVRYLADPHATGGRVDPATSRAYSRLLTRLSFSNGLPSDTRRSVLLIAVESDTMPVETSERVAEALALESSKLGIVLDVFAGSAMAPTGQSYWETVPAVIGDMAAANDLVLVPGQPLDRTATGLGLASVVRETLLLVTLKTPVDAVQLAIDDLRSVDADDVSVVVVTHVPRRSR